MWDKIKALPLFLWNHAGVSAALKALGAAVLAASVAYFGLA